MLPLTTTMNSEKKVAAEWTEMNHVEITPEMINCAGCRVDGVKTPFCDSLCQIRQCGLSKKFETCGSCGELMTCGKVKMIIGNNRVERLIESCIILRNV